MLVLLLLSLQQLLLLLLLLLLPLSLLLLLLLLVLLVLFLLLVLAAAAAAAAAAAVRGAFPPRADRSMGRAPGPLRAAGAGFLTRARPRGATRRDFLCFHFTSVKKSRFFRSVP